MNFELEIEWTEGRIWEPQLYDYGYAPEGNAQASLELHMDGKIQPTQRYTRRP